MEGRGDTYTPGHTGSCVGPQHFWKDAKNWNRQLLLGKVGRDTFSVPECLPWAGVTFSFKKFIKTKMLTPAR